MNKSIQEISESLMVTSPTDGGETPEPENEEAEELLEEPEEEAEEAPEDEEEDTSDGEEEEDEQEEEDEEDDGPSPLDVTDDDLIEVMIDGELQTKTLGELKQAMGGEGAIYKRLQEATEERKAAIAERKKVVEDAQQSQAAFAQVVQHIDQLLFTPQVQQPDISLSRTDPSRYQAQMTAFQQDQQRINQGRQQLGGMFESVTQQQQQHIDTIRKSEGRALHEKLPILRDEKVGPERKKAIYDAAAYYGFSTEEIKAAYDHRIFLMAHDAAMYRKAQKGNGEDKEVTKDRKAPRLLRSGKTTAKKRVSQRAKQSAAAKERARASGKVDDIAATLISPQGRNRRR